MSGDKEHEIENAALQSSEDSPALGQDESDFGAGGQTVIDPGAEPQNDVNRDGTLADTAQDARTGGTA